MSFVKDLAASFRTRIELRQIGVRDEARKLGGLGPCGREICCGLWLDEFKPVTSQLARDQQLVVNPSKISGLCGRLMCCLTYEQCFYEILHKEYPEQGQSVCLDSGRAQILKVDIIKDKITIKMGGEDGEIRQLNLETLRKMQTCRRDFLETFYHGKTRKNNHGVPAGTPKP